MSGECFLNIYSYRGHAMYYAGQPKHPTAEFADDYRGRVLPGQRESGGGDFVFTRVERHWNSRWVMPPVGFRSK